MGENVLTREHLRHTLGKLYGNLLSDIASLSYPSDQKLTGFSALVGSQYEKSDSRLLVYGRAVDGWRNSWNLNSQIEEILDSIFKIPEVDKNAMCDMNWLERNRKKWVTDKKTGYNYKFSSFWSGARDVLKALDSTADKNDIKWPSRLAWSNVYKISPDGHGNPGEALRSIQWKSCKDILDAEINHLKPKNILFVTGGWGKKILEGVGIAPDYSSKTIVQFARNVEFKYGKANVVVAVRPERQKRDKWVSEVVSAFGSLS